MDSPTVSILSSNKERAIKIRTEILQHHARQSVQFAWQYTLMRLWVPTNIDTSVWFKLFLNPDSDFKQTLINDSKYTKPRLLEPSI